MEVSNLFERFFIFENTFFFFGDLFLTAYDVNIPDIPCCPNPWFPLFSDISNRNTPQKNMKKHRNFPKIEDKVFFSLKNSYKPYKVIGNLSGRISRRKTIICPQILLNLRETLDGESEVWAFEMDRIWHFDSEIPPPRPPPHAKIWCSATDSVLRQFPTTLPILSSHLTYKMWRLRI